MAFWSESRSFDDAVRRTDNTLNVLVVVLLVAFALGASAYYYGQMNPRVTSHTVGESTAAPSAPQSEANPAQPLTTQPHP